MSEKEKPKPLELKKEVSDKYSVIAGFGIGECHFKGRKIHLDQISLEEAEDLIKEGFNVLVPKKNTTPVKAS